MKGPSLIPDLKARMRDFPGGPVVKTSPSSLGGVGSVVPRRGAKIPHALQPKHQNIKQKQYCNKFNKDFKNDPHQKKIFLIKIKNVKARMYLVSKFNFMTNR